MQYSPKIPASLHHHKMTFINNLVINKLLLIITRRVMKWRLLRKTNQLLHYIRNIRAKLQHPCTIER